MMRALDRWASCPADWGSASDGLFPKPHAGQEYGSSRIRFSKEEGGRPLLRG
ncbi:MAG: hypothetical protein AB1295_01415 [Candidatus Micrarchaeota archaeon]